MIGCSLEESHFRAGEMLASLVSLTSLTSLTSLASFVLYISEVPEMLERDQGTQLSGFLPGTCARFVSSRTPRPMMIGNGEVRGLSQQTAAAPTLDTNKTRAFGP